VIRPRDGSNGLKLTDSQSLCPRRRQVSSRKTNTSRSRCSSDVRPHASVSSLPLTNDDPHSCLSDYMVCKSAGSNYVFTWLGVGTCYDKQDVLIVFEDKELVYIHGGVLVLRIQSSVRLVKRLGEGGSSDTRSREMVPASWVRADKWYLNPEFGLNSCLSWSFYKLWCWLKLDSQESRRTPTFGGTYYKGFNWGGD